MNIRWIGMLVAFSLTGVSTADPVRPLPIQVRIESMPGNSGQVRVTYLNNSGKLVRLPKGLLPQHAYSNDIFDVRFQGVPVDFHGIAIESGPLRDVDFETIAPGQSIREVVNLPHMYDMAHSGTYEVNLRPGLIGNAISSVQGYVTLKSNIMRVHVSSSVSMVDQVSTQNLLSADELRRGVEVLPGLSTTNCSAAQRASIEASWSLAIGYADDALDDVIFAVNEYGESPRYRTWFGISEPDRDLMVHNIIGNVQDYFNRDDEFQGIRVTVDCSCKRPPRRSNIDRENSYAWVEFDNPKLINLCPLFWTRPTIGTDSQAGIFYHEVSHFDSECNGLQTSRKRNGLCPSTRDAVVDGVRVYGKEWARVWAEEEPQTAIRNADNYEYWAENEPVLNNSPPSPPE